MFDNIRFATAARVAQAKIRADKVVTDTKEFVGEHKSEMTRTATITTVVYVTSRVAGFKAGYTFAKTPMPTH